MVYKINKMYMNKAVSKAYYIFKKPEKSTLDSTINFYHFVSNPIHLVIWGT